MMLPPPCLTAGRLLGPMRPRLDSGSEPKLRPRNRSDLTRTSDQHRRGFLGGVSHAVGGDAGVDTAVVHRQNGEGQRAVFNGAPLRKLLPFRPQPPERRRRVSARHRTHQSHRIARVHHHRVVQEELDGGGC